MRRSEALREVRDAAQLKSSILYGELDMDDGFVNAHTDSSGPGTAVDLHTHPFFEIVFVERGPVDYILAATRYQVGTGDLIFVPPQVGHRPVVPPTTGTYDRLVVWVNEGFVRSMASYAELDQEELFRPGVLRTAEANADDQFRGLIGDIVREDKRRDLDWQLAACARVVELLVEMHRFTQRGKERPAVTNDTLLDRLLRAIERAFRTPVTARDVARELLVSEGAVEKVLREELGTSFHRYVTTRRLIEAKTLMLKGEPVTLAASLAGFSTYSTFFRAFKSAYGLSPTEFLEAYRQEGPAAPEPAVPEPPA